MSDTTPKVKRGQYETKRQKRERVRAMERQELLMRMARYAYENRAQ